MVFQINKVEYKNLKKFDVIPVIVDNNPPKIYIFCGPAATGKTSFMLESAYVVDDLHPGSNLHNEIKPLMEEYLNFRHKYEKFILITNNESTAVSIYELLMFFANLSENAKLHR